MHTLYYECFSGISGDMNLAAMIGLGVDPDILRSELEKLNLPGWELKSEPSSRSGIHGTRVTVVPTRKETAHRHMTDIEAIIRKSTLSDRVKNLSISIFNELAIAEAKVHNSSPDKVHFHEVGAVDSIIDIVGAAICHEQLDIGRVMVSTVELGGGMVKCAHGLLPVPAPATAELVKGMPVSVNGVSFEATTPTGAAILKTTGSNFGGNQSFRIIKTAYGIGHKDGRERPNILRVSVVEPVTETIPGDNNLVIECNIDDMNPEWYEGLTDRLMSAGASDVWLTPVIMKKGRPGTMISVLTPTSLADDIRTLLYTHSTTLGTRTTTVSKHALRREFRKVNTPFGEITVKIGLLNGRVVSMKPEYEECRTIAERENLSLDEVNRIVMAAVKG